MSAVVISVVEGWPMGQSVEDLAEYAMAQGAEGYEVHEVRLCRCAVCGGEVFGVHGDLEERSVQRICRGWSLVRHPARAGFSLPRWQR
jgi:hypothetical protein